MQPDDSASRKYNCVICQAITSRMLKDGAVCTKHFVEGYGRLPNMPLPAPIYVSEKDKVKAKRARRSRI